jgi:benzoyl-CoA reductase/2-hydroxyglutaryl-CoA dehydratase subunit BcrC/BadD/HgdB
MKRSKPLPALCALEEAANHTYNKELKAAKARGEKIVGYLQEEIPEEIFTAAGLIPVAVRGTESEGTEFAEAYFRQLTCNYTRNTFNAVLEGKYDFLDGAVYSNHCDHARRIFDNWQTIPGNQMYHFVYVPKSVGVGTNSKDFFREELKKLIAATEKHFNVQITSEKLSAAIKLHNETRRLQQELYDLQKGEAVYLKGSELMQVMLAANSMPRTRYNELLRELIDQLKANGETFTPAVRLIYTGGHADNTQLFELLESQGGDIVADNCGFGSRTCATLVSEEGCPLEALVDYIISGKPAATRVGGTQDARMARVKDLVKEFKADGVISTRLTMCDLWAFEQFMMRKNLEPAGIPLLELEVEYKLEGEGQIRTRVQAFVESILAKKHQ